MMTVPISSPGIDGRCLHQLPLTGLVSGPAGCPRTLPINTIPRGGAPFWVRFSHQQLDHETGSAGLHGPSSRQQSLIESNEAESTSALEQLPVEPASFSCFILLP